MLTKYLVVTHIQLFYSPMILFGVGGDNHNNQCDPVYKTLNGVIQIACGAYHSIALMTDGTVECWGDNSENQCDHVYKTLTGVVQIAGGDAHSVALLSDDIIQCWGDNKHNQCDSFPQLLW